MRLPDFEILSKGKNKYAQIVDFINCFNGTKCSTIIVKRRNLKSENQHLGGKNAL